MKNSLLKNVSVMFTLLAIIAPIAMVRNLKPVLALTLTPPITPIIVNHSPAISAQKMYSFKMNTKFSFKINAKDVDVDRISMVINGLPKGVTTRCYQPTIGTTYCLVNGFVSKSGFYPFTITVKDQHGASTTLKSTLSIVSTSIISPLK